MLREVFLCYVSSSCREKTKQCSVTVLQCNSVTVLRCKQLHLSYTSISATIVCARTYTVAFMCLCTCAHACVYVGVGAHVCSCVYLCVLVSLCFCSSEYVRHLAMARAQFDPCVT